MMEGFINVQNSFESLLLFFLWFLKSIVKKRSNPSTNEVTCKSRKNNQATERVSVVVIAISSDTSLGI